MSTIKSSNENLTLNADGSGNDLKFQSNGSEIASIDQSGNLAVSGTVDGVDIATRDAVLTSTTTTANAALPKAGGTMTGDLILGDNVKLEVGSASGGDLQIYHDGNTSYIYNTEGSLILQDTNGQIYLKPKTGASGVDVLADGAVKLYHDNSKKIETTSAGAAVTGNLTTTGNISTGNNGMVFILDSAGQTSGRIVTDSSTANALEIGADPNNQAANSYTAFRIDNSEKMRINSSGNVGIGVVPESHNTSHDALQVGGNGNWTSYATQGANGEMDFQHNAYFAPDGNDKYISTDEASKYRQGGGKHQWYTAASGSGNVSWSHAMSIANDGKVGIGVTSPAVTLELSGNGGALRLPSGGELQFGGSANMLYGNSSNNYLRFDTNSAERMRIDSSGNVGIGQSTPQQTLHVTGQTRLSGTGVANDHNMHNDTVLEVRGTHMGNGTVDVDAVKLFKLALNDNTEYGGQAQFALGRWEENGSNARTSMVISLGHAAVSSGSNADADILELRSDGRGISQFTAKAWIHISNNSTINDSHNISSLTDMTTGRMKIFFSNNPASANYSISAITSKNGGGASSSNFGKVCIPEDKYSSYFQLFTQLGTSNTDTVHTSAVIFGD